MKRGCSGLTQKRHTAFSPLSRLGRTAFSPPTVPFNKIQSRVVIGLLNGHHALRRHLPLMELTSSPLCKRCGAEEETSLHTLCECEALASLRHVYLGSFLDPEDIKSLSLGVIWNFSKVTGLP